MEMLVQNDRHEKKEFGKQKTQNQGQNVTVVPNYFDYLIFAR